ncbi:MAG: ABC transporter permease [Treponema sp.]|nr:ABC transporter permease [Treponema sp.]
MSDVKAENKFASRDRAALLRARKRRRLVITLRIAFIVVMLGGWEITARTKLVDSFFFSMPSEVAGQVWSWAVEGTAQGSLWEQIWVTLSETLMGFILGVVSGVFFGILLGRNALLADVFSVFIKIANSIPRVVLGSIFIITLGLGTPSKVALAFVMVFFVVFANAFQGVREADRDLIANARILGASPRRVTISVVLPSALTWIIASLHVSFGFALVGAVVGEFLGARKGIGLMIATAQGTFNAAGVFASMLILAIVALAMEYLITALENILIKWRPAPLAEN